MHSGRTFHAQLMASAAAVSLLAAPAVARAADTQFNIAPQSLETALADFSSQSMLPVLTTPEITGAKKTGGVVGVVDPSTALAMLLQGTGLTYRRQGDTFLIVKADTDPQSGSAAGDGADGTVEALIVTAQKREEDIQDVPIAISAFTQEDLTRSQIAGGPDLMTQVPNFTFTKTNFSSYSIQIRGIGTQAISATTDAAVAVAFNNTPFIRNRFFEQEFYDLQRVEVLRGPQGTLYGRNATAGVVNILSAKPNLSQYEAKASGDVSNYNSTRLEGMVNIPLVEDVAALRLAAAWTKRNGYVENEITGNPIDGRDLWSARASLRFEPNDWFSANLIYEHFEEDDDRLRSGKQLCNRHSTQQVGITNVTLEGWFGRFFSQGCLPASLYSPDSFQVPNGFSLPYVVGLYDAGLPINGEMDVYTSVTQSRDLRVIQSTIDPQYRAKSDLGELQLSIDLSDKFTLTSETGYNTDTIFSTQDFNRFNTAPGIFTGDPQGILGRGVIDGVMDGLQFCDPQLGCADRLIVQDLSTAKSRQFSQEFRLGSDFDGPFNFSLGANFLRYDTEDKYYVFINTISLWAASGVQLNHSAMPSYQPGVSDNFSCLNRGMLPGDPHPLPRLLGCIYMDPNPIGSLNDQGHNYFLSKNPYKLISYAVFGETYYNITSNLKVTAGLRWTVDKKEAPRIPSWLLTAQTYGYPVFEVVRQEWREPTGRLAIDWKPELSFTDETLLYASYSHGYKAGGANPPPAMIGVYSPIERGYEDSAVQPKTFRPEFVNAFEVGAKNTLAEGRITLNANAFYYDYTDYQISQIVNRSATNYNFDAKIWGLELEADWRPLENLRLGLKAGYEKTRVGKGSQAIDIMDRTAGHDDWILLRPFPTVPSNCIVPVWLVTFYYENGVPVSVPGGGLAAAGPCVNAYLAHLDPVTREPYVPYPANASPTVGDIPYPGFDPSTAPNNGEGFFKDLSGHELPNAPHYTTTLTADYTLPLPHDWLMTLHSDFYYQSEAWTRIFNTPGYDKLKAYYNVNLAAIFSNEEAGWQVMAYVKNVLDADNITGAFLNSDDTGLTTNVFLNEPRLYGLRVTKNWSGSPWWTGTQHPAGEPWPFTVELGGQVQRQDAPNGHLAPQLADAFPAFDPLAHQDQDLDWGDGREIKLTYRPVGPWSASLGARFGRTNHTAAPLDRGGMEPICLFDGTPYEGACTKYGSPYVVHQDNYVSSTIVEREDHAVVDFLVGRDFGFGGFNQSSLGFGLRYAKLKSTTGMLTSGIPEIVFEDPEHPLAKYEHYDRYKADIDAARDFQGVGPVLNWDAAKRLLGDEANHLDLAWSVGTGVLFGKQTADISGSVENSYTRTKYMGQYAPHLPQSTTTTPVDYHRSNSVTVPVLDLSAGVAWEVDRFKVGAGYRWERYFDAIDGGYAEHKSYDRTIDGPYFRVSVGFGG
jgi:outer membrane receptor protein involved in Fe transport